MKPCELIFVGIVVGTLGTSFGVKLSEDVKSKAKPTQLERKIKDVEFYHKLNADALLNGIKAGYVASQLGLSLSNYLSDVQASLDKNLSNKIYALTNYGFIQK